MRAKRVAKREALTIDRSLPQHRAAYGVAAAPWWDERHAKAVIGAGAQMKSSHFVGTGGVPRMGNTFVSFLGHEGVSHPWRAFLLPLLFATSFCTNKKKWQKEMTRSPC